MRLCRGPRGHHLHGHGPRPTAHGNQPPHTPAARHVDERCEHQLHGQRARRHGCTPRGRTETTQPSGEEVRYGRDIVADADVNDSNGVFDVRHEDLDVRHARIGCGIAVLFDVRRALPVRVDGGSRGVVVRELGFSE